ncbi:MAG TPA: MFS transporter [Rhodanobacteraceae bacterium]
MTTGVIEAARRERRAVTGAVLPCTRRVGWSFIIIYGLAYAGLWMALLPPILEGLAMRVHAIAPVHAADSLSLVVGMGALLALFGNPFFGRLSDRTTSRFGRRRPWLIIGAAGGAMGLALTALATSIPLLLLGWCIAQLSFNAELAALAAVLSDQVPASQRGMVSGVVNVSLPLGMAGGTFLVQVFAPSMLAVFLVPAALALAGAIALVWVLPDRQRAVVPADRYGWRDFLGSFWINPCRFPDFAWVWSSRFLLFAGVAVLMTYQAYYLAHQFGYAPIELPRRIFWATLAQSGMLAVFGVLGGCCSDAMGRRKVFVSGTALLYALALLMIAFAGSYAWFVVGMAVTGMAQGIYLAVDLALVVDVLPDRETHAGRSLGVFNIANVLPQMLMPAIAPGILFAGGGSYAILFVVAAVLVVFGAWAVVPVKAVR